MATSRGEVGLISVNAPLRVPDIYSGNVRR